MQFRIATIVSGLRLDESLMINGWDARKAAWEALGHERRYEIVSQRIDETIEEAVAADAAGFAVWGTQEQHFIAPDSLSPGNETLFAAIAARTKRITLRPHVWVLPLHHPVNVAERIGFMDVLSDGRFEFGVGRGNSWLSNDAFGHPSDEIDTYEMTTEALQIIRKACTEFEFEHHGKYWQIPTRQLQPQPRKLPPVWFAAHSLRAHEYAGEHRMKLMRMGIPGVPAEGDWEAGRQVEAYWKAFEHGEPIFPEHNEGGVAAGGALGLCVEDETDPALESLAEASRTVSGAFADRVGPSYLKNLMREGGISEAAYDDLLSRHFEQPASRPAGATPARAGVAPMNPEQMIARIRELEATGITQVTCSFDAFPHELAMQSIELMGRYVIPKFDEGTPQTSDERTLSSTTVTASGTAGD